MQPPSSSSCWWFYSMKGMYDVRPNQLGHKMPLQLQLKTSDVKATKYREFLFSEQMELIQVISWLIMEASHPRTSSQSTHRAHALNTFSTVMKWYMIPLSGFTQKSTNSINDSKGFFAVWFQRAFLITITSGLFIKDLNLRSDLSKAALSQFLLLKALYELNWIEYNFGLWI